MIPNWTQADSVEGLDFNVEGGADTGSSSWEILLLNGSRVPGVALIGSELRESFDKQKPKGAAKGKVVDAGAEPIKFDARIELLPGAQANEFVEKIVPILQPLQPGIKRLPVTITHPQAAIWNVSTVIVGRVSIPSPSRGGTLVVSVEFIEYREPKKIVAKPMPKQDNRKVSKIPRRS